MKYAHDEWPCVSIGVRPTLLLLPPLSVPHADALCGTVRATELLRQVLNVMQL